MSNTPATTPTIAELEALVEHIEALPGWNLWSNGKIYDDLLDQVTRFLTAAGWTYDLNDGEHFVELDLLTDCHNFSFGRWRFTVCIFEKIDEGNDFVAGCVSDVYFEEEDED